jgi:transcriptional regulator with XRE-family HTH domain
MMTRTPHPLCAQLRQLRQAAGMSLMDFEAKYGDQTGANRITLASYERGDRIPPIDKLAAVFAVYGYQLVAEPLDDSEQDTRRTWTAAEAANTLRQIADQLDGGSGVPYAD